MLLKLRNCDLIVFKLFQTSHDESRGSGRKAKEPKFFPQLTGNAHALIVPEL